tara:strand:- start:3411 stop:6143 length:2733 start_codon:yes stop_codon:yes gene_type:complete
LSRQGASQVFFDIVGTFQAGRLIRDGAAGMAALEALMLDTLGGIGNAAGELSMQIDQVVNATVPLAEEIEKSRLEFQKFVSEVNSSALTAEIEQLGLSFGFTAQQSLKAGSRMAQLSALLGEEVVPAATEAGIAFGLIGDMETEDAMNRLISLQQQTKFMFEGTTQAAYSQMSALERRDLATRQMAMTLNRLNSVEDHSAATMAQITAVMNEFASQAHLTGESMGFMAAMSAVLVESGEQQGKAGRSLRMTYARLGADINGAAETLENYGVAVKDSTGSLRPLSAILADLQPIWGTLNSGIKQNVAQQVAGNRHYVRFIKIMENFDRVKALEIEAREQTAAVMDEEGNAIGYLDTLQRSNMVTLKGLRAELELVNSAIGERLIPGVISATQFQVDFNRSFEQLLHAAPLLSDALGRIVGMQQMLSNVFAPFFSAFLNIKAMNLALQTHMAVMRAVNGERLTIAKSEMSMTNARIVSMASEQANAKVLLGMKHAERKAFIDTMALRLTEARIRHTQNQQELQSAMAYQNVTRFSTAQELSQLKIKTGKADVDEAILKIQVNLAKLASNRVYAASSILRFEREIAKAKEIVLLNSVLINQAQQKSVTNLHRVQQENAKIIQRLEVMIPKWRTILTDVEKFKQELMMANDQVEFMNFNLDATSMHMNALMAGSMVADMVIMSIGKTVFKLLGVTDAGVRAARVSMIAMNLSMVVMIGSIGVAMSQMATFMAQKVADEKITRADAQAHMQLASAQQAVATGALTAGAGLAKFAKLTLGYTAIIIGLSIAIERVLDFFGVFDTEIEELALDTANFQQDFQNFDFTIPEVDMGLEPAMEQMQEFSNRREELFFGFKAGNVTGDLIKQVTVGGVDNFVANTEIIMKNEFHGMTTQEAAAEIISLIQEEGEKQGYSFG